MLWFRAPEKIYIKRGCLPVALEELKKVLNKSPKQFIKYINKHFIIKENFKVVVLGLEDGSEFWTVKETKQRAEETKAKFETCEKVSVKIVLNKYLLLK